MFFGIISNKAKMQESWKGGSEMRKRYEVYQEAEVCPLMLVRDRGRITTGIRRGRLLLELGGQTE